ncbi:23S rRNA pseudouridine(2605) synthase RluB [Chitinivorax sp. B]|uniref:23S rRNA pseudouridine(2605) synthase RluB n=1 Tax=Chitinivorax sp. B TaxID=2502235 RepID=UPI002016C0EA|nr:pseudouridine synthase [Chitinivorax sp. B]
MSRSNNRAPRNTQQFFRSGTPNDRVAAGRSRDNAVPRNRQPDTNVSPEGDQQRRTPGNGPRGRQQGVPGKSLTGGSFQQPTGGRHSRSDWNMDDARSGRGRRRVAMDIESSDEHRRQLAEGRQRASHDEVIDEAGSAESGVPRRNTPNRPNVPRARKMRERAGSLKEQKRANDLREHRVDPRKLEDMRLQKILALTGLGSRREMEELISAGKVEVNGAVATLGQKVAFGDKVRVDGKNVFLKWPDRLPRVILYHKQEGELVSRDDPDGRTTVFDRLPTVQSSKWVAVGRLDFNTSGLLIFTTSGELANKMMHPRFEVDREYAVRILGELTPEQMKEATKGIELDDGPAHFQHISDQGGEGRNRWYRVVLREGRNREVRRMFEYFGTTVSRLIRVRFGPISLPGRLKRGTWTELEPQDVQKLLKWAGLSL